MNCNFFTTHKGLINRVNICNILIAFSLYMVGAGILGMFFSVFFLNSHAIIDFTRCTLILLSTFPIFMLGLAYKCFKEDKNKENTEFTYKMFKDWYYLNPKRFVFDKMGFYYLVDGNPDWVDETLFFPGKSSFRLSFEKDYLKGYKFLEPKRFIDYMLYILFIEKMYFLLSLSESKKEKVYQQKRKNDELLIVLNTVQSDINKIMKDSQSILDEEAKKLERVRNEQLS